jgi:hypothetical protein
MGTSNSETEVRTPVEVSCRLDLSKDVQLKTLAKIWQESRQPHLPNKVILTEQVWSVTRYSIIIIIIIIIMDIIIVNTITIIIITTTIIMIINFVVRALSTITKKGSQL